MPEFQMPHNNSAQWRDLGYFAQGYVEALFFTSTGSGDDEELENATFEDLAPETLASIIADCAAWQKSNEALLDSAYEAHPGYAETRAGHDYWFTTQGHGVGFWSRDMGAIGDALSKACSCDARDLYLGGDGLLYLG